MSQLEVQNEVRQSLAVRLTQAILIYQGGHQAVATLHEVEQTQDGRAQILPGRGVTLEALQSVLVALTGSEATSEYLPPTILAYSLTRLVWWCPSAVRPLFFRNERAALQRLNGKPVRHPGLVFAATEKGLRVFAVAGSKRPTPDTRLYQAPYCNVYADGKVCQGTVNYPNILLPASVARFEAAFFESYFTQAMVASLTPHPKGCVGFWQAMRQAASVPRRWLHETALTLSDLLRGN